MFAAGKMLMTAGFSPLQLAPALWLDFSDATTLYDATTGGSLVASGGAIARVEDKSGNGRHANQATSGSRPTRQVGVIDGRDVSRYNGTSSNLSLSSVFSLSDFAIFAVAKTTSTIATGKCIYGHGTTGATYSRDALLYFASSRIDAQRSNNIAFPTATIASAANEFCIASAVYNGASITALRNGTAGISVAASNTGSGADSINIGAIRENLTTALFMAGDIAEIIVFQTALSTADRQAVESYLNSKYAIY